MTRLILALTLAAATLAAVLLFGVLWESDATDYEGAVGDALTRLAWRDDSQIVAWHAYKHYTTPEHPVGATITIREVRR